MFIGLKKAFIGLFIFAGMLSAQNNISVHQFDKLNYGKNLSNNGLNEQTNEKIIPLVENPQKSLNGAVFGYFPDWEYLNGSHAYFNYDLLTHIACFDFAASTTGTISNPASWPWTGVINAAHLKGVKIIMTITNFDGDEIHTIITNPTIKTAFINNVISRITAYSMDGVNIDFESLNTADRGSVINGFMAELTQAVHTALPGKEVSFAGPAVNWSGWNLAGLASSCDYIFIMGYDFFGSWSSTSGPSAPLTGGTYNITNTVLSQYASVVNSNPQKLILGVPYFGAHFITESDVPNSTVVSYSNSPRFSSAYPGSLTYGYIWNTNYKVPWYKYPEGNNWHQVWFDDDSSLALKYDLAISKSLKGVGMWALGYDAGRQELWNLIQQKFVGNFDPIPAIPTWTVIKNTSPTSIQIECEVPNYASGIRAYLSTDGISFNDSLHISNTGELSINSLAVNTIYHLKLKAFNSSGSSLFTETFSVRTNENSPIILIVNGFDRVIGEDNTRDYYKVYAEALQSHNSVYNFDCANNEAIYLDKISLDYYYVVIWILGEESTSDETFNTLEQAKVKEYLGHNHSMLISGAEIGWELGRAGVSSVSDLDFYNNYLRATYVADAPKNLSGTYYSVTQDPAAFSPEIGEFSFDNGTHGMYDTEWPDAIKPNNSIPLASYTGVDASVNGGAGIFLVDPYKLIHLAFPLETVYPVEKRNDIINKYIDFLIPMVSVEDDNTTPTSFELLQNYPNPFNPSTSIGYSIAEETFVTLNIYDILGRKVAELVNDTKQKGNYNIEFSGNNLSSGLYFATLKAGNFSKTIKMNLIK